MASYPFGGERPVTSTCGQDFKFEGKQRDAESGLDDFGARYYSSAWGRFASSDWSAVPVPVPYANLTNPQTLNLYAMVSDNPETFADLDGHIGTGSASPGEVNNSCGGHSCPPPPEDGLSAGGVEDAVLGQEVAEEELDAEAAAENQAQRQQAAQPDTTESTAQPQIGVSPDKKADTKFGNEAREQDVDYNLVQTDSKGKASPVENPTEHKVELREKLLRGDPKKVKICSGQCVTRGSLRDRMSVTGGKGHSVEKRFLVDGSPTKIYDSQSEKAYDFVRVDASVKKGFIFTYGNDPN